MRTKRWGNTHVNGAIEKGSALGTKSENPAGRGLHSLKGKGPPHTCGAETLDRIPEQDAAKGLGQVVAETLPHRPVNRRRSVADGTGRRGPEALPTVQGADRDERQMCTLTVPGVDLDQLADVSTQVLRLDEEGVAVVVSVVADELEHRHVWPRICHVGEGLGTADATSGHVCQQDFISLVRLRVLPQQIMS